MASAGAEKLPSGQWTAHGEDCEFGHRTRVQSPAAPPQEENPLFRIAGTRDFLLPLQRLRLVPMNNRTKQNDWNAIRNCRFNPSGNRQHDDRRADSHQRFLSMRCVGLKRKLAERTPLRLQRRRQRWAPCRLRDECGESPCKSSSASSGVAAGRRERGQKKNWKREERIWPPAKQRTRSMRLDFCSMTRKRNAFTWLTRARTGIRADSSGRTSPSASRSVRTSMADVVASSLFHVHGKATPFGKTIRWSIPTERNGAARPSRPVSEGSGRLRAGSAGRCHDGGLRLSCPLLVDCSPPQTRSTRMSLSMCFSDLQAWRDFEPWGASSSSGRAVVGIGLGFAMER